MSNPPNAEHARSVLARWRILAKRRLDHLVELYQSGRWKLYHKETEFLTMVQEARIALQTWETLAPTDSAQDKPTEAVVPQARENESSEVAPISADGVSAEDDLRKS